MTNTDTPAGQTFMAETLERYPGGLSGLQRSTGVAYSTLRRLKLLEQKRTPWRILHAISKAKGWRTFPHLAALSAYQRASYFAGLWRCAKGAS